MAETTNEETKPYDVLCPECQEEFEADIPMEALKPEADEFTVDCPECGTADLVIVYDAAADRVGLTVSGIEDEEDEDDDDEDEEEDEDEEDEDEKA